MNSKLLPCLALVLGGGLFVGNCHAAIVYPKAPEGGRKLVYEQVAWTLQATPSFYKGLRIEDVTIADPCQSYSVGLADLASGKLLSVTKLGYGGGWQYLLIHGTNAVGAAFLTADEKTGKALKCVELAGTGFSNGRLEALQIAEQLPQVKKQDYELRSLDMPWLLFSAVWLHGKSNDIIVPLPDRWKRWNRDQPYSEGEIMKILKPEAQRKLKFPPGMVD
jgi:hypothetical protein